MENWFAIFEVEVLARVYIIKIWVLFLLLYSNLPICWEPNLVWSYIIKKPECPVNKIGLLCSRSRSQQKIRMSMNLCPDNIFSTAEHFLIEFGMRRHHYELECHAEKLLCYLHCQSHSEGSYDQNITVSTLSLELLTIVQPNLVLWYYIIKWSVLWTKLDCCVHCQDLGKT